VEPSGGSSASHWTHLSTTDPDARLYRKGPGKEAKLYFIGHGLMENRHSVLVDACPTPADGHAERLAALKVHHYAPLDWRLIVAVHFVAYWPLSGPREMSA
jgi:hypothetical protein